MEGLERLSLRQITSLLAAAERRKMLLSRRRPISEVRKELIAVAAAYGYAIEELYELTPADRVIRKRAERKSLRKLPVRYLDPENRRNTWTGCGRMPNWLARKVSRGERAADYLVPGLARPTEKNIGHIGRKTVYRPETRSSRVLVAERASDKRQCGELENALAAVVAAK